MKDFVLKFKKKKNFFLPFISSVIISFVIVNHFITTVSAMLLILSLLFHEFGHWIVARLLDLDPRLPIFIPFGIFIVGMTNIKQTLDIAPKEKQLLYAAGGISSLLMLLSMLATPAIAASSLMPITLLIIYEIMNMTIGLDGRKIINARRDVRKTRTTV